MKTPYDISQVGSAYLVSTEHVNWVLVEDGDALTLIDGGYPGNVDDVERSVAEIGHEMGDIQGALLTHAHVDHLGGLVRLAEAYDLDAWTGPIEVAHARRDYIQQLSPARIPLLLWRRGAVRWLRDIVRLGGADKQGLSDIGPYSGSLDLPGSPVAVATPGHTDGHTAYLLPDAGVLVSGDALITGHAVSRRRGPQQIPGPFTHDHDDYARSLETIAAIDAGTIFPGHGPVWTGSMAAAAAQAAG